MIKNAIFLSCDAENALIILKINFLKVLNFDKVHIQFVIPRNEDKSDSELAKQSS